MHGREKGYSENMPRQECLRVSKPNTGSDLYRPVCIWIFVPEFGPELPNGTLGLCLPRVARTGCPAIVMRALEQDEKVSLHFRSATPLVFTSGANSRPNDRSNAQSQAQETLEYYTTHVGNHHSNAQLSGNKVGARQRGRTRVQQWILRGWKFPGKHRPGRVPGHLGERWAEVGWEGLDRDCNSW